MSGDAAAWGRTVGMAARRMAGAVAARRIIVLAWLLLAAAPAFAADDWQEGAGPEWQAALEAGRKEGKVVVAVMPSGLSDPMAAAFERDTGIQMEFINGSIVDLTARYAREAKAGNVTIDVMVGGGNEVALLRAGLLEPIKPQFLLPKVTDPAVWIGGKMHWMDSAQEYMFQGSNGVHGWPLVNSQLIDPKTLTSWQDLLKPEFKGKIAAEDPRNPGPGQAAAAYLLDTFGVEFLKQLYIGQQVTYTRDSRQLVEWVARGTYPVALGAIQVPIEAFRAQGMTQLAVPVLSDGSGAVVGSFSVLKEVKNVPHPAAARVFMNWYASRAGQEIYSKITREPSTRLDVKVDTVPDYVVPRPGVNYPDQYAEDWYAVQRPKVAKAVIEALGGR
jgi:ABC-type Fe3+ transport system substrate-binding protein